MKNAPFSLPQKIMACFLIPLILSQSMGCRYFKYQSVTTDYAANIHNIGKIHKYFIVHHQGERYELKDITADSTKIAGNLIPIDSSEHRVYYFEGRNKQYTKKQKDILHEVHIYLNAEANRPQLGHSDIPLTDLGEIRIIEKNTGAIVVSYLIGTLGVMVIIVIIAILTKSSCPYIYVDNGEAFIFEGETYGGAIAANLERDDYMPLPSIKPTNSTYKIRISNELKERQYTDLAELITVNHPEEQKVMLDKYGEAHSIGNLESAISANSYNGTNLLPTLEEKNNEVFMFNDEEYAINGVILKFKKPIDVSEAKLLINGQNTLWFDYLFGEFLSKFGSLYNSYMEAQSQIPRSERMQRMLENDFPLSIYLKQNGEWKLIDYLFTVGPLASRDFVIPIDLSEYSEKEIEIKIETGFMFWEMDYAAIDFTQNTDLSISHATPFTAFGTNSNDWKSALEKSDGQYMAQENIGDVTEINFKAPPVAEGETQTAFLHTRGYYELIREFEGLPKLIELNKFKTPGYFSEFSRARYLLYWGKEEKLASIQQISD